MAATEVLDLRDYMQAINRRRRWVVVSTVIGMVLALWMSFTQQESFRSSTEVLVLPATVPGAEISPNDIISMPNELQIAGSASVAQSAENAARASGFEVGTIEVTNPTDTQTLVFEASALSAAAAQATATAYADAYLKFRQENLLSSINARLDAVTGLIQDLSDERADLVSRLTDTNNPAETAAIQFELNAVSQELRLRQQEQNELELAADAQVGRVLEQAALPAGPSSPRPIRNAIIGGALGFLMGIGLALLRDRLDQRVRGREDVEAIVEAPVLGFIPEAKSLHRMISLLPGGDRSAAEAFRALRTRVLYAASREGFSSMMVTSSTPTEGKTTTATNLAVALAQAETRVVLVSADLHHPGLWRYLPERGKKGLADVLAGTASLSSVVIPTDQENLSLLPSGTLSQLPEAALGSADMQAVIDELRGRADLVVLDSAPVLGVSDTLELASIVDTVIFAIDAASAKKDLLRAAVGDLRSVGASIMGIVLLRPDELHTERYSHRYGYREGSERIAEPSSAATPVAEGSKDETKPAAAAPSPEERQATTRPAPTTTPTGTGTRRGRAAEPAAAAPSARKKAGDEGSAPAEPARAPTGAEVMMRRLLEQK